MPRQDGCRNAGSSPALVSAVPAKKVLFVGTAQAARGGDGGSAGKSSPSCSRGMLKTCQPRGTSLLGLARQAAAAAQIQGQKGRKKKKKACDLCLEMVAMRSVRAA